MHPAIGRWDLCSGDRLPKARSRWRNPRVALTFTIHGSATWAPAGCAAASRSSLRRDPPTSRGPVTRALRCPPRRPWDFQLRPATWAGVGPGPLPPGRTSPGRREARARATRPTMPGPRANGRSGPPSAGRSAGPGCLTRRFRFVFPTAGVPGRRDALRAAGSQGPWQRPPVARRARLPEIREGGAQIRGAGGEPQRRGQLGRDRARNRGVRGGRSGCVRSRVHSETSGERGLASLRRWPPWCGKQRRRGEVASDNKLEVGGKLVASSRACDRRPPAAPGRALPAVGGGARALLAAAGPALRPLSPALRVRVRVPSARVSGTCSSGLTAEPPRRELPLAGSGLRAPSRRRRRRRRSGARRAPPLGSPGPPRPCLRVSPAPSHVSVPEAETEKHALQSFFHRHTVFYPKSHFYSNILLPLGEYLLSGILVLFFFFFFFLFLFLPPPLFLCFCFFFFFFFFFFSTSLIIVCIWESWRSMDLSLFLNPSFSSMRRFCRRGAASGSPRRPCPRGATPKSSKTCNWFEGKSDMKYGACFFSPFVKIKKACF